MKLSPGAKRLRVFKPRPFFLHPPSSRDCRRPPIVHLAASLRRRPRRRSRPLLRPPRHLLDPPPRPPRVPSTPPSTAAYERRRRPPASTPLRSTSTPIELVVSFPTPSSSSPTPFPSLSGAALPGRSCTAAVGVPPPRAPKPPCLPGRGRAPHSRRPALRRPERRRRCAIACASWGWAGPLTDQWGPAVSPCLGFSKIV